MYHNFNLPGFKNRRWDGLHIFLINYPSFLQQLWKQCQFFFFIAQSSDKILTIPYIHFFAALCRKRQYFYGPVFTQAPEAEKGGRKLELTSLSTEGDEVHLCYSQQDFDKPVHKNALKRGSLTFLAGLSQCLTSLFIQNLCSKAS